MPFNFQLDCTSPSNI